MSKRVGTIYYTVEADTAKLLTGLSNVEKSLDELNALLGGTDKAAAIAESRMNKTALAVRRVNQESASATSALSGLQKILAGALTIQGVSSLVQMAEGYNEMAERVRMATASQEEYEQVQQRLLTTANGTYRALSEAQELYIRTADSLRSMGYSTQAALDITDSMSYAFVVNAASNERADAAIQAYTKSINKGRVEADAWETILTALPTVVGDLAAATGKSADEVRALGASGKLTAQQLNQALLQSLERNKTAADGMAVTVRDAYRSLNNSLSAYLGEANQATGATGVLATAIKGLGDNIDLIVGGLLTLGAGALAGYVASLGASVIASARAALAARAQAVEELRLAEAHVASTSATVAHARANVGLTGTFGQLAAAEAAHAAAMARTAAAQAAVVGLGTRLLAVFGGPAGLIALLAAGAMGMMTFGDRADVARDKVRELIKDSKQLGQTLAEISLSQVQTKIAETERQLTGLAKALVVDSVAIGGAPKDNAKKDYDDLTAALQRYRNEESRLRSEMLRSAAQQAAPEYSDQEAARRLEAMRQELELSKKIGVERAKLQAIRSLGEGATDAQKAEAERLATSLYQLEQAHKGAAEAAQRRKAADSEFAQQQKANAAIIADLEQELRFAALAGEELAAAKAAASLNKAATPEEVAQVEALAKALSRAAERKKTVDAVGADPAAFIRGNVQPLSGGAFDDQAARYDAEAQAEQQRYADQLARLQQAQQAQIEVQGGYDALKERMAEEHKRRIEQIERAKQQVMLSAGEQGFGAMADIMRTAAGEQSSLYKTMFAASKAFAIAQSLVSIQQGVALAAANPWPVNLAAMASVATATAGLVSNIAAVSLSLGGGRQYGGPVDASKMYRINESGRPEVFQAANGRQYMLPNTRGEVVSNKDATAQQAPTTVVNIVNQSSASVEQMQTQRPDGGQQVDVLIKDLQSDGKVSRAMQHVFGLRRQGR